MSKTDNILICKGIKFYSSNDEDIFFERIKKIDCIDTVSKIDKELYLYVAADNIHDYDLRDLIGLFYRYKIKDMKQLKRFLTDENKKWFYENKRAFWHQKVFGSKN
jgi:hypothetical protein